MERVGGYMPGNAGPGVPARAALRHLEAALYCLGVPVEQVTRNGCRSAGRFQGLTRGEACTQNAIKDAVAALPHLRVTLRRRTR